MDAAGSANFAPRGFTDEFGIEIDITKVNGTSGTVLARSLLLNFVLSLLFVIIGGVVLRFVLGIVLYSMQIPKEKGRREGETGETGERERERENWTAAEYIIINQVRKSFSTKE